MRKMNIGSALLAGMLSACLEPAKGVLDSELEEDNSTVNPVEETEDTAASEGLPGDLDGDGFFEDDCDDTDPAVNPAAAEVCNEQDDNCNGEIDELLLGGWFQDGDGDGYGDAPLEGPCGDSEGVSVNGDCDDSNPEIHPNSTVLIDGVDSDCNGRKDWLATIWVAVDDAGELCVNNTIIGEAGNWMDGRMYEVWLQSGAATIGIHGWDVGFHVTAAIAHIELSDGSIWVSDSTWRYDPEPDSVVGGKQGWCSNGFDDTGWDLVLDLGPIGDASNPWGNAPSSFPSGSPAHWIWDHFPVNLNTQFLRKQIPIP